MGFRVRISKEAERDLQTAMCHYKVTGMENSFIQDLKDVLGYLTTNPPLFQVYYRNVRRAHFPNFIYSVHYTVNGDEVSVLRLLHHKQNF